MQNQKVLPSEAPQIITGKTKVRVKKRITSEMTGKESVQTIHEGIVVAQNSVSSWLKVYSKKNGDTALEHAEWFPRDSKLCWCEISS